MSPQLRWKFIFILIVVLVCLFGLVGFPTSWAQAKQNFADHIHLGLDLKGGSHLVLQVQVNEAVGQRCDQTVDDLKKQMREKNVSADVERESDTQILARHVDLATSGTFRDIVSTQFPDWTIAPAAGEPNAYLLTLKPSVVADIERTTMDQALETITRRINALGLTEPTIAFTGRADNEILVELPGEGDPTRAKQVIQAGGQLSFNRVADEEAYPSEAAALAAHGGVLPPGTEIVPGQAEGTSGQAPQQEVFYILDRAPIITGADLRSANPSPSQTNPGQYQVDFTVSTAAAARFGPFTEANIGHRMAIVLDHKVHSAPVINGRIDDRGMIEGNFTQDSAQDLSLVLRAGALPASIRYLEERTIGPSLGIDSIREGVRASVGSLLAVMIFLLVYYRLSGVNAVVALILNLVILIAFMGLSGAVLTLPGIAGVVLTIGMGVDSNVLVFERIREERRNGKAPASAVQVGFDRAFLTIIDTHITTLVSAAFLFIFGTGPVKGFAITLVIGLLANLFTSIYVSRAIFDFHLSRMVRQAELSI
jgi:preprotein translocase subunit SecD